MEAGIDLKNIVFGYGKELLFNGLNLNISSNKLTCLMGSTGSGKTSILRLIAGLEIPSQGQVIINNKVASASKIFIPPNERRVGLIFQDLALWPHFTVLKNVLWGLNMNKVGHATAKTDDMLNRLKIAHLSSSYPHELSGGEKQLVAFARSLVLEPKVLLMDEPLSNLDPTIKKTVIDFILELKGQGNTTMVYVTHDTADADQLADEVILLNNDGSIEIT